ncbi:MAG TPA: trypsin-like peptidase domain-containing protein [Acetobacteraceae bacterium]|nr:trypsin-like peptidase domain-containing protein [Acetobacteraceae bacterium]
MTRPAAFILLSAVLLASGCSAGRAQSPATPLVEQGPLSFAPLVRRVVPAVVNIAVTESVSAGDAAASLPPELKGTPFERQFRERMRGRREQVLGAGSGFIIDASGVIVTNNHVVGHADRIVVSLSDGTQLPAKVLGVDELTDLAVIKVETDAPLPYVTWGDSREVQVGDWILAAGNPFGLGSSVTAGIVSARGRDIGAGPFDDFIQLDAPINPGNSGGPTFNLEGQVIAVNTAIVSPTGGSVGIGFAVPSEIAERIVAELRAKGHIDRGWLGVSVQDLPGTRSIGVAIAGVDRFGPASRAGLRVGDIVTAVNGEHVDSARGLIRAVAATNPGGRVRLRLRRQAQTLEVTVTVGRRPHEPD